ncbi:MAG TPA: M23 family metallopeptidase [Planctomycetota bacterium]|nr:M23 family metallopeptidase [Planctomycetota bacterium]
MGAPRLLVILALSLPAPAGGADAPASRTAFGLPCEAYARGLRGKGNFGVHVTAAGSPFTGSYHLAEDVWLPARTVVRSVADGVVRYSDFSPTWSDDRGRMHWNLGNVIVIEHPLEPAEDGLSEVCSFYVHLSSDRKVAAGDKVKRGQVIGAIGADRSEENGRYPAHLHFGLHKGPYVQIPPAWKRRLQEEARTTGIPLGPERVLRGEIAVERHGETDVLVTSKDGKEKMILSLLVGSTSPGYKPRDIMAWCEGYGDKGTVDEWLRPSAWIEAHRAKD